MDHVQEYMKKHGVEQTRENYLDYAYLGNPPAKLGPEEEEQLPEEFQHQAPEELSAGIAALGGGEDAND
jgi:hypothetical protein